MNSRRIMRWTHRGHASRLVSDAAIELMFDGSRSRALLMLLQALAHLDVAADEAVSPVHTKWLKRAKGERQRKECAA
jgi:hypothetical protein